MAEPSLVQRERALLKRLASLVADRADGEKSLDVRMRRDTARAEVVYADTVAKAEAEITRTRSSLEAEHQRARDLAQARFDALLSAAKNRMEKHLRTYSARTTVIGRAANQEYEESKWLAETMVESGELKIRSEFELARKAIEKKLGEIKRAREWAEQLLADGRYAALPPDEEAAPDGDPTESREDLAKAFEAARIQADE